MTTICRYPEIASMEAMDRADTVITYGIRLTSAPDVIFDPLCLYG
jgi:hypothetical protein